MTKSEEDRVVEKYRELVYHLAYQLLREGQLDLDVEELVGYGFAGLLESNQRYDPSRGVQFKTFAYYRIRGAMIDGLRTMAKLSRRKYQALRRAEAVDRLTEAAGEDRAARKKAGSDDPGSSAKSLGDLLGQLTTAYVLTSMGKRVDGVVAPDQEQSMLRAEAIDRVQEGVETLPERERKLVEGHYFDGRRFDEIAAELGISKAWASRLHTRALERLRDSLTADDDTS